MSLWMVLVVAGQISGTWGPLPYDMKECQVRRAEFQQALKENQKTTDWSVDCEFHKVRPELGDKR